MKADIRQALAARIAMHFAESANLKTTAARTLSEPIATAGMILADALRRGGKILACGNGGSAGDAQHFAAELVNRFEIERPPFAAIALTTDSSVLTSIANDYDYKLVFAKQVTAIGQRDDILLAISTSGNSPNVIEAIVAAQRREMRVIALTGKSGGKTPALITDRDVHICVPHNATGRIQEVHLLILHCLCDAIDHQLLSEETIATKRVS